MTAAGPGQRPSEQATAETAGSKLRVAHLTSVHPPHDPRLSKQCESLLAAGYDVCLVAQEGRTAVPGLRHLTIPPATSRLRRSLLSSWHVLRGALASGAKVCHFHDPELVPVGMVLALLGRKVVYDVHEDVPLQILNKKWLAPWLRRPMAALTAFAEWLATRVFFAGVVAATPPIARRFPKSTTATVQNFPQIVASAPAPSAQSLEQKPDRAIYIGSINENRGLREIIKAVHLSTRPDAALILCGRFTDPALEAECRALPGWARVDFRGWQTSTEVLQALSEAKVGLVTLGPIPNYIESYPIKLFEYMAMGIPVIASDFPLWRTIVEEAQSGILVDPLDPEAIAEAMDWLMSHPQEAAQMGINGQKAVATTYNWPGEAAKLLALYERFKP